MTYRFRLRHIVFRLAVLSVCVAAATVAVAVYGNLLVAALFASAAILAAVLLCRAFLRPLRQIRQCLLSLRCRDTSVRIGGRDARNDEAFLMNEFISEYKDKEKEVESQKKFYSGIMRVISHEVGNSITPIMSLSDYYMNADDESVAARDYKEGMRIINDQSRGIKTFLEAYRKLLHLHDPVPEKIYLPEFCDRICTLFRSERGGDCITVVTTDSHIYADPVHMQLLLVNLLRNALHAVDGCDDAAVELRAVVSGGVPVITVTDNGCGIPSDRINDIFDSFYTTKSGGTGIGLCIAKQIMLMHGGEITVDSNPRQRFTVFTLTFPSRG